MARVLRPGGVLVYADLAPPQLLALLLGKLGGHAPPTRAALDEVLEELGLVAVRRHATVLAYEAVLRKS
jgi:hypothetical protein